jgi:hypothetical protein
MTATTLPDGLTAASAADQVNTGVTAAVTGADATSADRVQNLSLVHQSRVNRLTRTAGTAAAQYGAKSAQAVAAQAAVTSAQTVAGRIALVQRQLATPAPQVATAGWALHGRVYDAKQQPVAGHTVFLVDAQNNYVSAAGFAYTDDTGYFLIEVSDTDSQSSTRKHASSAAKSAAKTAAAPAPAAPAAALNGPLFIQIANKKAKPVYLSSTPFEPVVGTAAYQNIPLPAGEPVLGDPPEAIRAVALPKSKS